jgi:hypothetical protein
MHTIILSCGLLFLSLLRSLLVLLGAWLELALLNFVLQIVELGNGRTQPVENERNEQR